MVRRHSHLLLTVYSCADVSVLAAAWIGAYFARFESPVFRLPLGDEGPIKAPFSIYLRALPLVLFLGLAIHRAAGLYVPRRDGTLLAEVGHIAKASVLLFLVLAAFALFYDRTLYSRIALGLFAILSFSGLVAARTALRVAVRALREKGYNRRNALIVGAGKLGRVLGQTIHGNPWTGIAVVGYLADRPERVGGTVGGDPVVGTYEELRATVARHEVDHVFLALPWRQMERMEAIIGHLREELVDVRLVPDLRGFMTLNASVSDFDGLPLISLRESPLVGWNLAFKRATDVAISGVALVVLAPLLLAIALAVKLTSPGPVFYRQRRMGLDGRTFEMLKFRSMVADAEQDTGEVWARPADERRTSLGAILRSTSADELPQLVNVLRGEMSLVGPRPERPVFIEKFKKVIPRYMLRHKMKAGITGWAQINGWRGNTSLRKRVQYDLYYIENWSIWFDLRIMFLTLFRGLVAKNAY